MKLSHAVILTSAFVLAVAGCDQSKMDKAKDQTKEGAASVGNATKEVGEKAADKTAEIAGKTAGKTKEIAELVAAKTKEASQATAEAVTDGWITAKIAAKFTDETSLEGSKIDVDTKNHVVTLKGTATSAAAKAKAQSIAKGTKGVTKVVNQIAVK